MIKITSIEVYQLDLPIKEGKYSWSHGNSVSVFDSTLVKIKTNKDIFGFGEVCTLGPAYLPAYPEGVSTGIKKIGNQYGIFREENLETKLICIELFHKKILKQCQKKLKDIRKKDIQNFN